MKISVHWSLPLLMGMAVTMFASLVEAAEVQVDGYLMDNQCISLCVEADPSTGCTPDDSHAFYTPYEHTGWCLMLQVCEESGYSLMSQYPDEEGRHSIVLTFDGNASQNAAVEYIKAGTDGAFPLVTVIYDEDADVTEGPEGTPLVQNARIMDPWDSREDAYSGNATTQVLCADANEANVSANNYCFRSDVVVSVTPDDQRIVIESNGCPDHDNMKGSKGTVPHLQEGNVATSRQCNTCGGCGGCCGGTCCSGGCGSDGCCGGTCCSGGCGSDGCNGGTCCSGGCGSDGCCGGTCCSGGCGSGGCDGGTCCSGGCGSGGCDGGTCCAGDCSAICGGTCCSGGCGSGGCGSGACCGGVVGAQEAGCGGCCGSCGGCCGSCGGSCASCGGCGGCEGSCGSCGGCGGCGGSCGSCGGCCGCCGPCSCGGHGQDGHSHGTFTPFFQHYTMTIPQDPGNPGEPTTIDDDVVGIMTNGVLLDSHKQTWSYDSCNGHSDKKHQYHYHLPPICFLQSMGVSFADSPEWWIADSGEETREFSQMAEQFPETGPASPLIGWARDGYPIYGPYDDSGTLQRGAEFGGSVDECNGKIDSNGQYGYYMTVDPPFAPPCLRGQVGTFAYSTTDIACPKDGIENTIEGVPSGNSDIESDRSTSEANTVAGYSNYVFAFIFGYLL